MKVNGLSEQAMRFQGTYWNLPFVSDSGVMVRFIEIDKWLHLMVEIDEDTTSEELRKAIPMALSWRDRLLNWQGPWLRGGDNPFLEELLACQESGETYSNLAERINKRISAYLSEYNQYLLEYEKMRPSFKTMGDFYSWKPKSNGFSLDHARGVLSALGYKKAIIEDLLLAGLENIRAGRPAFEKNYPVSREKIIGVIRRWRIGKKHKIIKRDEEEFMMKRGIVKTRLRKSTPRK
jgi:hypothetical protein